MTTPNERPDARAFLSVILWPRDMSRDQLADLIGRKIGQDAATVRLRLGQSPPSIVGWIDPGRAAAAVSSIMEHGGEAFAPTMAQIESLGPTLKIKRMERLDGTFKLELWRGPPVAVRGEEIAIVIRGRLSHEKPREAHRFADPMVDSMSYVPITTRDGVFPVAPFDEFGAYGLASLIHRAVDPPMTHGAPKELQISHKIDLHTADGRVFQIDGDKFAFEVLGDYRGHGDLVNTDRLCELIALFSPKAVVDPYYSLFKPPPEHRLLRLPMWKVNNDEPAFAFYSRWAALMYRHLLSARTA